MLGYQIDSEIPNFSRESGLGSSENYLAGCVYGGSGLCPELYLVLWQKIRVHCFCLEKLKNVLGKHDMHIIWLSKKAK